MREKKFVNNPEEIDGIPVVQDGESIFKRLNEGKPVMHWEEGMSMFPILMNREYCLIKPCKREDVMVGDAVFCSFSISGNDSPFYMVHRCDEILDRDGVKFFRIVSTDGTVFGWTKNVYGIAHSTNIFQEL